MKNKLISVCLLIFILAVSPCLVYAAPLENAAREEEAIDSELEAGEENVETSDKNESVIESEDMTDSEESAGKIEAAAITEDYDKDSESSKLSEDKELQPETQSASSTYLGKAENDSGDFANVVIFVEFSDTIHDHIESPWGECYHKDPKLKELFQGGDQYPRAMKKYLQNISYNQFEVANIFPQYDAALNKIYPYTLKNNLDYYADDPKGDMKIIEEISEILASSKQISSDIVLDRNGDGNVDNLTIIVPCESGNSNKKYYGHQSQYQSSGGKEAKINNSFLSKYTLVTEGTVYLSVSQSGVLVHEFLHTLGYPDLYNIKNNNPSIRAVGTWDIMATQNQWLQYPLAYFRSVYTKWFNIPTITDSQKNYSLYSASDATENVKDRQAVILKTDYSSSEFFVLEYRKKNSIYSSNPYDQQVYGSGLIIYRINTEIKTGNSYGPPYMAYVFRMGDTIDGNGYENANAQLLEQSYFSTESGRTSFGNSNLKATLEENAITYSDGTNSGIVISNIGSAEGDQISFDISFTGSEENLKWKLETEDTTGLTVKEIDSCIDDNGAMYYIAQTGGFNDLTSFVLTYKDGNWRKIAEGPKGREHKIAVYNNEIYLLYLDSNYYVKLDKYSGNKWSNLFTSTVRSTFNNIVLNRADKGVCFGYIDEYTSGKGNSVYIYQYSDAKVQMLGNKMSNTSEMSSPDIVSGNGYVAVKYYDTYSHNVYIKKYESTSNAWSTVLNGTMQANNSLIKQNGNRLFFLKNGSTWGENKSYLYVYDMSVTNGSWSQVGTNEVMDCSASEMDICFNGSTPCVVYSYGKDTVNTTYAMEIQGDKWVQLGLKVSIQPLTGMSSYCDNGKINITYLDSTSKRIHVRSLLASQETEVLKGEIKVNPDNSSTVGRQIQIEAEADGGAGGYQYCFYVVRNGEKIVLRNYSANSSYIWTPVTPAKYQICVDIKDKNFSVITRELGYEVKKNNLEISSFRINPAQSAVQNETVKMEAMANSEVDGVQYRFYVIRDGKEIELRAYSPNNTFEWKPFTPAKYQVCIDVKDRYNTVVTKAQEFEVKKATLKINSFTIEPGEKVIQNNTVQLSVNVSGGAGGYEYSFYVIRGNNKIVLRNYSSQSVFSWTPYTPAAYKVCVAVRDKGGNIEVSEEDFLVESSKLQIDNFQIMPAGNGDALKPVTMTAFSSLGSGRVEYCFYVIRDGKKIPQQAYSTKNTFVWIPITPAQYQVCVDVKDSTGKIVSKKSAYTVNFPLLKIKKFEVSPEKYTGEKIRLKAEKETGGQSCLCQYYVIRNGVKIVLKDFSDQDYYDWTPMTPADYEVVAVLKDSYGRTSEKKTSIKILPATFEIKELNVGNNSSSQSGQSTPISVKTEMKGDAGKLQYKYYVVRNGQKIILQNYTGNSSFTWTPITPAKYQVCVDIMDRNGKVYTKTRDFQVTARELYVNQFTMSVSGSVRPGTQITLNADATGGSGNYKYKFYVVRNNQEIVLQNYSVSKKYIWSPFTPAKYDVCVTVMDGSGAKVTKINRITVQ